MTKSDKLELQRIVQVRALSVWDNLTEMYPKLVKYDCPEIIVCLRLTRCAGKNYQTENRVHIAGKFFVNNKKEMLTTILPHELIHQADFNLHGLSDKRCGHGKKWTEMMVQYGLPADKYHSLEL